MKAATMSEAGVRRRVSADAACEWLGIEPPSQRG
jgi:hypothetical protein